jgi:hypothetical protein
MTLREDPITKGDASAARRLARAKSYLHAIMRKETGSDVPDTFNTEDIRATDAFEKNRPMSRMYGTGVRHPMCAAEAWWIGVARYSDEPPHIKKIRALRYRAENGKFAAVVDFTDGWSAAMEGDRGSERVGWSRSIIRIAIGVSARDAFNDLSESSKRMLSS